VAEGVELAVVQDETGAAQSILAPFAGVLRGLIHPSVRVHAGMKIGDLDPRADVSYCFTVSDKSLAIGGGALEAILMWLAQRQKERL
jgi:xanthine dehydrogenase accessory factor